MYKHTTFFLLLCLILVFGISPSWIHAQTKKLRVVEESAKLLLKPDPESQVVRMLPLGAILELDIQEDEWYRVKLPPDQKGFVISGYIHSQYVEVLGDEVLGEEKTAKPQVESPPREKEPAPIQPKPPYQPPTVTKPQKAFQVKLMGGLGIANLSFSDLSIGDQDILESAKKSLSGIFGGIGLSYGKAIGIQVNALYMRKGAKFADEATIDGVQVDIDSNLNIDQLSIPILIKYKLTPGSSPFILAGGEIGFVLSAKLAYTLSTDTLSQSDEEDLKEDLKSMDYGLVLGAGYEANLGGFCIGLEGRYHLGLQNILDISEDLDSDEYIKTSAAVIACFIKF